MTTDTCYSHMTHRARLMRRALGAIAGKTDREDFR